MLCATSQLRKRSAIRLKYTIVINFFGGSEAATLCLIRDFFAEASLSFRSHGGMLNTGLIYQIVRREFGVNFNIFCDLLFLLVRFFLQDSWQYPVCVKAESNNLFLFGI